MSNRFLNKYKDKTEKQLREIVSNPKIYQPEAVSAANKLLGNHGYKQEDEVKPENISRKNKDDSISILFDYRPFVRIFNTQQMFSSITIVLVLLALTNIIEYYSDEKFIEPISNNMVWILYLISIVVNHIVYRKENNVSNNLTGRVINDIVLLAIFLSVRSLYNLYNDVELTFSMSPGLASVIALVLFIVMIYLFELILGLLNTLLKRIRWDVL